MGWRSDIQLLKLPLRLPPERGRPFVQAPPFLGELDQAASAVLGRRLDRDEAVAFQEANHFPIAVRSIASFSASAIDAGSVTSILTGTTPGSSKPLVLRMPA